MNPIVSIVFTSYNHKEYLSQAIDSLVNQSYKSFELIIVDDCSTDGSQEIIEEFYAKYPEVIKLFLLDKNTGSYVKASNFGAKQALGEYLLFAQCDDYSEKNQVERLVDLLDQNPQIGVVYSRSNLVDKNGTYLITDYDLRTISFKKRCHHDSIIEGKLMRRFLTNSCVIPNLSAAMLRKELFTQNGGLSEKYLVAADWAFWLDMSERTNFYYITEALNNFRQHETTIRSSIKVTNQLNEFYTIFYSHIHKYKVDFFTSLHFRIGVARIWLLYYFEDKKMFRSTFFELLKKFFKLDNFIALFLFLAGIQIMKEIFSVKLKKKD